MKSRPRPTLSRIRYATLVALASIVPAAAQADSTVFQTTFATDTIHAATPAITPTGTNWYIMSSKDGRTTSVSGGGGLNLTYAAGSTASAMEGVARFTTAPIVLDEVGESITARATVYTDLVRNLAIGLYNSGGVDPLTTLNNAGLASTPLTVSTGGTLAWKGYRGRLETGSASGSLVARQPQTGAGLTQLAYSVVATSSGDYNSPGPVNIGSVPASSSAVTLADGYGTEYRLIYKITRSAANAYTISYTVTDSSDAVLYSVSGTTTNAGVLPNDLTSSFDAIALGTRNNAPSGATVSTLAITALSVTAANSDVAHIVNQPINQTWVAGTAGTISVTAAGTGALSYQWYKGTDLIPTATSATYTVASPSAADNGDYHVVVTNAYGTETSKTVSVSFTTAVAPNITVEPASQTVNEGETLSLSVEATGAPTPTYQWYKNTGSGFTAISGATQPTFSIVQTAATDAASYQVIVTNSQGSDTSATAVVSINSAAPAITTPPANVTVNVGEPITLSAAASGYPAPTFQWYKFNGATYDIIPGATASTYTIASAVTANNGTYHVVATNRLNSATSADTTVTVNVIAPSITTPPANTTVTLGQPASFTVAATGSAPLSYQWYKGPTLIEGATSATYTINPTTGSSAGAYHVVVNNESNTPATSTDATLNLVVTETSNIFATDFAADLINPATPSITPTATAWYVLSSKNARTSYIGDNPATTDVVETDPYTMTMEAVTSSGFIETAARFASTPVSLTQVGSQIRVTSVFRPRNVLTLGFGLYNSGGSNPKQLDFDAGSSAAAADRTVLGTAGTSAVGAGTQNWVGYRSTLGNLAGTGNVGQGLATRPAQINTTTNRGQELCVTGSGSTSYGEPAGVGISTTTKTPASDAVGTLVDDATYTLVLTVSRSNTDEFTYAYQLYQGEGTGGTLFRAASGATTATGTKPSEVTQAFDSFALGLRNVNNTSIPRVIFDSVQVEHSVPVTAVTPSITAQPSSVTVAVGAPFTLSAAAAGSPTPTYQWYKNTGSGFTAIPDATSSTYSVGSASTGDTASYKFIATNAVGTAESDTVTVTVGSAASAYEIWSSAKGLTAANNGASQDPDGDGVTNLLEFTLGGDPLAASTAILPVVAKSGANLTLTYNVEVAATEDYNVVPKINTDLASSTWNTVVHGSGGATIVETPVDADTDHVVVTVPAGARTFLRVEVSPKP